MNLIPKIGTRILKIGNINTLSLNPPSLIRGSGVLSSDHNRHLQSKDDTEDIIEDLHSPEVPHFKRHHSSSDSSDSSEDHWPDHPYYNEDDGQPPQHSSSSSESLEHEWHKSLQFEEDHIGDGGTSESNGEPSTSTQQGRKLQSVYVEKALGQRTVFRFRPDEANDELDDTEGNWENSQESTPEHNREDLSEDHRCKENSVDHYTRDWSNKHNQSEEIPPIGKPRNTASSSSSD